MLAASRLREIGEPGIDHGALSDLFELNTHSDVELAMNDEADGVELLVLVGDIDLQPRAGWKRVEHVEIDAFATDVAGARHEAGLGAGLDDLS